SRRARRRPRSQGIPPRGGADVGSASSSSHGRATLMVPLGGTLVTGCDELHGTPGPVAGYAARRRGRAAYRGTLCPALDAHGGGGAVDASAGGQASHLQAPDPRLGV